MERREEIVRYRKLLLQTTALGLSLLLGACGGVGTTSVSTKVGTGAITVSMLASQPNSVLNVNTNWFTKYAERTFGLRFKFDLVPAADVAAKQALLLASGKYPDVFWNAALTQEDALRYGQDGVLVPLNSLIKKYAPNVWHAIKTFPGYRRDVTAPNGKIYGLPQYSYCFHCFYTYNYYIDLNYLNKFHLNLPKTTQQFAHVLAVFKEHGLVPLTGSPDAYAGDVVTFLMNSFIPYNGPGNYFAVKRGKAVFVPAQPQWEAGLEYIHALYQKGYFSKVALTQQAQAVEELVSKQKVGVVPNGAIETVIPGYGSSSSHYLDWFTLPPLKGPKGAHFAAFEGPLAGGGSNFVFAVTNKATKAQEIKVMKLINFIFTNRGAEMLNFGPQGKFWHAAKKGQRGLIPQQALFETDWNAIYSGNSEQNEGIPNWGPTGESKAWRNLNYAAPPFSPTGSATSNQLTEEVSMAGNQAKEQYPPAVWVPASEAQTYATEQTNIDNYVASFTDEFITGEKSLRSDWSSYLSGLRRLGLANYMSISQKVMGKPENANIPDYNKSPSDIRYILSLGTVPPLVKKYLLQEGVPVADFSH